MSLDFKVIFIIEFFVQGFGGYYVVIGVNRERNLIVR